MDLKDLEANGLPAENRALRENERFGKGGRSLRAAVFVFLGTFPKIYAALEAQEIDAGVLTAEYRFAAQRAFGLRVLADMADLGFPPSVLATTRGLIGSSRGVVARVVQGYVETIHLFKTKRPVVVPLLHRYLQLFDRQTIEDIYEYHAPRLQELPVSPAMGIQTLLNEFVSRYRAARTLSPTAIVDTSFLDQLEQTGFVTKLYGK